MGTRWRPCTLLIGAIVLSRFLFRSHYLYDIDSVNFALALDHFDPTIYQPHPPGYFLYVCLGRLANSIFNDANTALVAISIAASAATGFAVYILTEKWFGRRAALFAGLIFLFSPLSWFHGTVALTYVVEAFFSALVGYLCWRIYSRHSRWVVAASIALGLGAGFRPTSLLMLGPVWLLSLSRLPRKQALVGCAALVVTLLAWFLPMLSQSGGASAYFSSLGALWLMASAKQGPLNSPIILSIARLCVILGILALGTGTAALALLKRADGRRDPGHEARKFTWVWIGPGILFFTFIFLRFVNSGYLLVLFPPIFAWLGQWASQWFGASRLRQGWKMAVITTCAAANTAVFLFAPFYCSYSAVRRFERKLVEIVAALPQIAAPGDTLIVGFDSHFLGYRHSAYYLPAYLTVQYPEVRLPQGLRVFAVEHRRTLLLSAIPRRQFKNFVLFPLPGGSSGPGEYAEYLSGVRARFQPGALRTTVIAQHEFVVGSASDLPALFPNAAPQPARVYTELHAQHSAVYSR
jgi:4-amino-4-deoxy-L-arabinose transferase-like glycosyltransferase